MSGPFDDYYLSQTASGEVEDSPCLDSAQNPSISTCFNGSTGLVCMDDLTTRTDNVLDLGQSDMGYHHEPGQPANPTPTRTPTQTPTDSPIATRTPTFTPIPSPSSTPTPVKTPPHSSGVSLQLSEDAFQPGDVFLLTAVISKFLPITSDSATLRYCTRDFRIVLLVSPME